MVLNTNEVLTFSSKVSPTQFKRMQHESFCIEMQDGYADLIAAGRKIYELVTVCISTRRYSVFKKTLVETAVLIRRRNSVWQEH